MWSGNLAPNDSDLRSSDFLRRTVNESNLLSEVEAASMLVLPICLPFDVHILGCVGIINTLNLDQAGAWSGISLATGIAQVTAPSILSAHIPS